MRALLLAAGATTLVASAGAAPADGHVGPRPGGAAATGLALPAAPSGCPPSGAPAPLRQDALLAENRTLARFGARPTASPNHETFVDWIGERLQRIPEVVTGEVPFDFQRWLETSSSLQVDGDQVRTAGAVPYARATPPAGVRAPVVHLPAGVPITAENAAGRLVVRDVLPGRTPMRNMLAVSWFVHDPDGSVTRAALAGEAYERDFTGNKGRVADLQAAAAAGAAGLVLVHAFPREQVDGQYAPYDGVRWGVPAVYVGADEGARLKAVAARAGTARLVLRADDRAARTRMLVATLPGAGPERIVVQSHTDGMNAVWDNGPIAMLALLRHFASVPRACRPRTLQFVFTTGHLFQALAGDEKGGSAELVAEQLDRDYGRGEVAFVLALEHLGAREYAAVPRTDGGPGRRLEPTGRNELSTFFTGHSPVLVDALSRGVVRHRLDRSLVLRGADTPAARIPIHRSFGGEGGPYHRRLVPTMAFVTGPWSLYNPSFGLEAIDPALLTRQVALFADVLRDLAPVPGPVLAGGYLAERAARDTLCASGFVLLDLATCPPGLDR